MCGIAGVLQTDGSGLDPRLLEEMTGALAHRGPDGEGYVLLAPTQEKPLAVKGRLRDSIRSENRAYMIGLGHRRLAIVDLTALGHQPMGTPDGLFWITYNGEVYNAPELRRELSARGYHFLSTSDTEVVLAAYRTWGKACLDRFNGMFAFAIWDSHERVLFCARDRFGIKPFYYRQDRGRFLFASEIKALLTDRSFRPRPNDTMVFDYLTMSKLDHTGQTFFRDISQLEPGSCLMVRDAAGAWHLEGAKWWQLSVTRPVVSAAEAIQRTRDLLEDAVRLHLRADVPVGSCLSGGLDSSAIVCVMARLSSEPVPQTFSCGHDDPSFDERRYSRIVTAHTRVRNVEVVPDAETLWKILPEVLWHHDEPIAGTSVLAQWEVMRVAGQAGVKVLLDGQGGDELLLGYPRYVGFRVADLVRRGSWREGWREWQAWHRLHADHDQTVLAALVRGLLPDRPVRWLRSRMTGESAWLAPVFHRSGVEATLDRKGAQHGTVLDSQVQRILHEELPALLHFEDRNSMAFSIEARVPLLDHRLVAWLVGLSPELKLHRGITKRVLRDALIGIVPDEVRLRIDKMGFVTPQDYWLRGPWQRSIEELLDSERVRARPFWQAGRLREWFRRYCDGHAAIGPTIWRWIALESWLRRFCD